MLLRCFTLVTLVATIIACNSWARQEGSLASVIRDRQPDRVRLHLATGERIELRDPTVSGDSITGRTQERANETESSWVVHLAVSRVSAFDVRETDVPLTVLTVALGSLVALLAVVEVFCDPDPLGRCTY